MTERFLLDHLSLNVEDFERAKAFYAKALAPLGISLLAEIPAEVSGTVDQAGFGIGERGFFWLASQWRQAPPVHIAFGAQSRAMVDAFHAAALAAGGADNGAPGLRPHYSPTYYGAFVLDPEGHNVEAVCRGAN
ncbi:MAG: glyoxalase/bleomycin resistance/extradiol dioxygenase family protein [Hyphomicrobiales bacterium]|nr:MAG: glyoxalase/bleomycin resistance/extradiol dioxygenase family protein [Hyphomicrobiales bacterium]